MQKVIDIENKLEALKAAWLLLLLSSKGTLYLKSWSFIEKAYLNLNYLL